MSINVLSCAMVQATMKTSRQVIVLRWFRIFCFLLASIMENISYFALLISCRFPTWNRPLVYVSLEKKSMKFITKILFWSCASQFAVINKIHNQKYCFGVVLVNLLSTSDKTFGAFNFFSPSSRCSFFLNESNLYF